MAKSNKIEKPEELIAGYQEAECLWNVLFLSYKNRNLQQMTFLFKNPSLSPPPFLRLIFYVKEAIIIAARAASLSESIYNVKKILTCLLNA